MKLHKIWCRGRFSNGMRRNVPVVITLTWIFIASFMFGVLYRLFIFHIIVEYTERECLIQNFIVACIFCVYPLGGRLAVAKFSHYKVVLTSMHVLLLAFSMPSLCYNTFLQYTYSSRVSVCTVKLNPKH